MYYSRVSHNVAHNTTTLRPCNYITHEYYFTTVLCNQTFYTITYFLRDSAISNIAGILHLIYVGREMGRIQNLEMLPLLQNRRITHTISMYSTDTLT